MPIRNGLEIPRTQARQRWAASLRVGLDLEEALGVSSDATQFALSGAAAFGKLNDVLKGLVDVGTIESLDFNQDRKIKQRFALGPNALNSFQNVPQQINYTLTIGRVVLKRLPEAEAVFNFLPSNLVLQQFPFVIELRDVGDGSSQTEIRHFLFGCWFSDSKVRYDVSSKDDTRLLQNVGVNVGSVLTFDQSNAGSPSVQLASSVTALVQEAIDNDGVEDLISDLNIA